MLNRVGSIRISSSGDFETMIIQVGDELPISVKNVFTARSREEFYTRIKSECLRASKPGRECSSAQFSRSKL